MIGRADVSSRLHIRRAWPRERDLLEDLQLRAALVRGDHVADLLAQPDAVALTPGAIEESRVRVATEGRELVVGFCEWSVVSASVWELEGVFVEPGQMRKGIGTRLLAEAERAGSRRGVRRLQATAEPRALGFYRRLGFAVGEETPTRFGPGIRVLKRLAPPPAGASRPGRPARRPRGARPHAHARPGPHGADAA